MVHAGCPELISELAASCCQYVEHSVGVGLDFTPETLPVLEHYLASVRPSLAERDSLLSLLGPVVGAYFGEVVRRKFGGFWLLPGENVHDWKLCLSHVFLSLNPVGVAYDAVVGGHDHPGPRSQLNVAPEDRPALAERLLSVPPLPEDEYFTLGARLETLEIAVELLHAQKALAGYEGVIYVEDDYTDDVGFR